MVQAPINFERYAKRVRARKLTRIRGRVTELTGLIIKAAVPGVRIGEMVEIDVGDRVIASEVVGFRDKEVMLMPFGRAEGVGPDSEVTPTGHPFSIRCGPPILGRVVNGLGQPVDELGPLEGHDLEDWGVERDPPQALERDRIKEHIAFGVRAIDGLLTIGKGQRVGLFAGSGVGKSTLMGQIARNCEAEVVVSCLIGERGREVKDYIEESLGEEGMKKSVVVVATSDEASLIRQKCAFVATSIAEWFRNQGAKVLLMMDSTTRFARAQREIGLAVGEPPARQGYPPSVFAMLPRLLERSGNSNKGSITALYTVLVAGGDMEEPISDEVRGILDGHIILNRALGARNHWPAIDILPSLSRVMSGIVPSEHKQAAAKLREVLATYEKQRDLILLGAYQYGTDPKTDYAIDKIEAVEEFLRQRTEENDNFEETINRLISLFE
jgi:ATP synthase in type III secretion protein N